jgi:predicted nucleotidyltransferase
MRRARLSESDTNKILKGIWAVLPQSEVLSVSVFGSRADPQAKGGDLDLWIQCKDSSQITPALARKIRLSLHDQIGEQKIDILLTEPAEQVQDSEKRAFLKKIIPSKVDLWVTKNS